MQSTVLTVCLVTIPVYHVTVTLFPHQDEQQEAGSCGLTLMKKTCIQCRCAHYWYFCMKGRLINTNESSVMKECSCFHFSVVDVLFVWITTGKTVTSKKSFVCKITKSVSFLQVHPHALFCASWIFMLWERRRFIWLQSLYMNVRLIYRILITQHTF